MAVVLARIRVCQGSSGRWVFESTWWLQSASPVYLHPALGLCWMLGTAIPWGDCRARAFDGEAEGVDGCFMFDSGSMVDGNVLLEGIEKVLGKAHP